MYFGDIYSGGRHWATNQWYGSAATTMYLLADWLGGLRMWKDQSGNTDLTCENFPFGDGKTCQGGFSTTWGVFGDENDSEDNTYHTDARQHSPTQGRWLTPDPAGLAAMDVTNPQTWNRYAYVTNNPVSMTDPLGLDSETSSTDSSGNITDYTTVDVTADLDISNFAPLFTSLTPNNIGGFDVPGETVNVTDTLPTGPQTLTLSPQGQDCLAKVQSAVNSALNTSTAFLGPQMGGHQDDPSDPGLINGAYNFNFRAPGVQFGDPSGPDAVPGANCGRFGGSGLHIPVPGGGCNPSHDPTYLPWGFNAQQNGSYFTAHIDSANPFDDLVGFFNHLINDVFLRSHHGC
jgi:RHS repeat-associated protein